MISFEEIRSQAEKLGWNDVGIAEAKIPQEDISAYLEWLEEGRHADLHYMENKLRCDPETLLPGAKRAVIFISYYKQPQADFKPGMGVVASYARGRDYHHVHRKRLKKFIQWLENTSGMQGIARGFSDSAPVMEKALAVRAGLGWFGKNTLLIHRKYGTFTLLSGLFTTLELPLTSTQNLRLPKCGSCRRCLDACPTQAFPTPYKLDANKCLSYHLIESKNPLPEEIKAKNPGYVFGCDICQNVCPHNVRKPLSTTPEFSPEKGMGTYLSLQDIETIIAKPQTLFGTPLQRKGSAGLRSNME